MNLSAPTMPVFAIAVVLAILAALVKYAGIAIPVVSNYTFEAMAIAFVVLLLGNVLKNV